jgi:protein-S-isoprenylcysteine O-methyltransferase Ste14
VKVDVTPRFILKSIASALFNAAFFGALLFGPAGTLAWGRAWVFVGVTFVATLVTMLSIFPGREDLLRERLKPPIQRGQPLADKVVILVLLATFVGVMVFIPLDVFRFHLMGQPGPVVSWCGLILFVIGWWIISLSFRENAFAAPVVKHQEERHQTVIDSGVYGIVRHPMYAGAIPYFVGMPLWLGSYAAAVLAIVPIAVLALRIVIEERFLKRELRGYDDYTWRVRYRLIPFVW